MKTLGIPLPLLIGVVCGVLVVNIVLIAACVVIRRRRQARTARKLLMIEHKRMSFLDLPSKPPPILARPQSSGGSRPSSSSSKPQEDAQLANLTPLPPRRRRQSPSKYSFSSAESDITLTTPLVPKTKTKKVTLPPIPPPPAITVPPPVQKIDTFSIKRSRSMRSVRSADSESLYSVASATKSIHDRLFRRDRVLDTIPASPLTPSQTPPSRKRHREQVKRISTIREELAPETYHSKARSNVPNRFTGKVPQMTQSLSLNDEPILPPSLSPIRNSRLSLVDKRDETINYISSAGEQPTKPTISVPRLLKGKIVVNQ